MTCWSGSRPICVAIVWEFIQACTGHEEVAG